MALGPENVGRWVKKRFEAELEGIEIDVKIDHLVKAGVAAIRERISGITDEVAERARKLVAKAVDDATPSAADLRQAAKALGKRVKNFGDW